LVSNWLALVASPSIIIFGNKHMEEYFNVANIDYYDVILGMLFLR